MPRDLTRAWAQAEDVRPPPRGAATPTTARFTPCSSRPAAYRSVGASVRWNESSLSVKSNRKGSSY